MAKKTEPAKNLYSADVQIKEQVVRLVAQIEKYQKSYLGYADELSHDDYDFLWDGDAKPTADDFRSLWYELKELFPNDSVFTEIGGDPYGNNGTVSVFETDLHDSKISVFFDEVAASLRELFLENTNPQIFWPDIDHENNDQKNRQKYARNENRESTVALNRKSKKGIFVGTSGVNYKTTLESCSCEDFKLRSMPCKHIYRLAYELGIIEPRKRVPPKIPKADKEITRKELGISPGKTFRIQYMGSDCEVSERDIEILKLSHVKDKLYIYGFCYLRRATRLFLASNIISMTYEGQKINKFQELFEIDYSTPADLVESLAKEALEDI